MHKIKKLTAPVFLILVVAGLTTLFSASCNGPLKNAVLIPVPDDSSALGKINHRIKKTEIARFRTQFNGRYDSLTRNNPDLFITKSEGFNKPALLDLLKDPDCTGIRIYYGITKGAQKNELRMVLVGIDRNGNDLFISGPKAATDITQSDEYGLEYGQCCQEQAIQQ